MQYTILPWAVPLITLLSSTVATPLIARQSGCQAGSTGTDSATGGSVNCGNDGQWYGGSGVVPASQVTTAGSGNTVNQGVNSGSGTNSGAGTCTQGATGTDKNTGGSVTCGADGQWYGGSGVVPASQVTPGGSSTNSGQGNVVAQNQPTTTPVAGSSGAGSSGATGAIDPGAPAGYSVGFSTQDTESDTSQSGCSTDCPSHTFIFNNNQVSPSGRHAAAINPAMIGGDRCGVCGLCYDLINAGVPSPQGPGGPNPQPGAGGTVRIWIVNTCTNCAVGQFDVTNAPAGWDNPKVYYKQVDC